MTLATIYLLTPEIVLIAAAVAIYLGGAFSAAERPWRWIAAVAVSAAAVALWFQEGPTTAAAPLNFDTLAWHARWLALGFGAILVLMSWRPLGSGGTPEYVGSLLLTVAGLMLVSGASELVLLFVGLELISIPTYVLLYLGRRDVACQESAAKYFFLSVLSSAILLYGFSFLYGIAGSTNLTDISGALERIAGPSKMIDVVSFREGAVAQLPGLHDVSLPRDGAAALPTEFIALAKLAMVLCFAGLCFKITAAPFHFYAPDVYQGTTYPNAAVLSVLPKAAALVALVRILVIAMPHMEPYSWRVVLVVSVLTMTLGNVMALWQDNLRRLLAYSSIAHTGYMLIGLAVGLAARHATGSFNGVAALGFYLVAYAAATIGAFALLEHLGGPGHRLDGVEELAGLGRTRPLAAAVLAVCLFSLAGVPPLAGFWGKLLLFGSALNVGGEQGAPEGLWFWFVALAAIGVVNAAVAAAYYLRIVAVMYFRTPLATPRAEGGAGAWWAAVACALLVIGIGLSLGPLMRETNRAVPDRFAENVPPPQSAPSPGVAAALNDSPRMTCGAGVSPAPAAGTAAPQRPEAILERPITTAMDELRHGSEPSRARPPWR
jgi:NADH-quinone oxidoreductase subunit N